MIVYLKFDDAIQIIHREFSLAIKTLALSLNLFSESLPVLVTLVTAVLLQQLDQSWLTQQTGH